jgi:hypothetical protein
MTIARQEKVDEERKHFENLFQQRINFLLVFASIFVAAVLAIKDDYLRLVALFVATMLSLLFTLAIVRTYRLVKIALDEIIEKDKDHPYTNYQERIAFPWNANNSLVVVPFIITALFAYMWIHYVRGPRDSSKDEHTITVFQDNSDRRASATGQSCLEIP